MSMVVLAACGAATKRPAVDTTCARNVILLIGDGMGDSEITSARNYHVGAGGRLALDGLPHTGTCTTYSIREDDPNLPEYVVDSAASATAWATGHKTSNRRLSSSAATDRPLTTLVELAERRGLRTGSVTTAELTDATPAALVAHINDRSCHGPQDMQRCPQYRRAVGGSGSIAEQSLLRGVDVLLGGGRARFEQVLDDGPDQGQRVVDLAPRHGYRVVHSLAQLDGLTPDAPVLGLFAAGNLRTEWTGEPARAYPGSGPQRCVEGQRPEEEPSLAAMTRRALDWLADDRGGPGFFLQVEGASIDKMNHAANPCAQIGEVIGFDAAVREALEFAADRDDTLVIVTGDHAHSSQIVSLGNEDDHPAGAVSTLITVEGAKMTLAYGTNLAGRHQQHSGTQIRVAALGPQAAAFTGVIDQTEIFRVVARVLRLTGGETCDAAHDPTTGLTR